MRAKGDHITIPESTLRRFVDSQSKQFAYYDLSTGTIEEEYPGRYNTEIGYFPQAFEALLSREVERHIGILHAKLKVFEETQGILQTDDGFKETLIRIVTAQTFRMRDFFESMKDDLAELCRRRKIPPTLSNMKEIFYTQDHLERLVGSTNQLLASYTVRCAIVSDSATGSFLLPPTHFFQAGSRGSGGAYYFIPMSPRYAFVLLPREANEKYIDQETWTQGFFDIGDDDLSLFVPHCIKVAKQFKDGHLIGEKQYLQHLSAEGLFQSA